MSYAPRPAASLGLFVVRQFRRDKGVFHFGILDVGNMLGLQLPPGAEPMIIHQPPSGLQAQPLSQTGPWESVGRIHDLVSARRRLVEALRTPRYNLFGNNCEHFVAHVATGVRRSPQLAKASGVAAAVVGLAWLLAGD
ncbi:MAG: hypothetical protein KF689_08630 [Gemmatimonadaceae bacterium]|nr:hypothetical protein [Gemmatimonadaceae bacterium]MCW5826340.1 hypothetical protein [Gemmatimonadaceae bacterium]